MEKYKTFVKMEEIKELVRKGEREEAVRLAGDVNLRKIKLLSDVSLLADLYMESRNYEKAAECLEFLLKKQKTRSVIVRLINLSLKTRRTTDAEYYYAELIKLAPNDSRRFSLRYKIDRMKGEPFDVLIGSLERLKEEEPSDEWEYELAKLYHKAGRVEQCIRQCEEIEIWYGDGEYVERASALKGYYTGEITISKTEDDTYSVRQATPDEFGEKYRDGFKELLNGVDLKAQQTGEKGSETSEEETCEEPEEELYEASVEEAYEAPEEEFYEASAKETYEEPEEEDAYRQPDFDAQSFGEKYSQVYEQGYSEADFDADLEIDFSSGIDQENMIEGIGEEDEDGQYSFRIPKVVEPEETEDMFEIGLEQPEPEPEEEVTLDEEPEEEVTPDENTEEEITPGEETEEEVTPGEDTEEEVTPGEETKEEVTPDEEPEEEASSDEAPVEEAAAEPGEAAKEEIGPEEDEEEQADEEALEKEREVNEKLFAHEMILPAEGSFLDSFFCQKAATPEDYLGCMAYSKEYAEAVYKLLEVLLNPKYANICFVVTGDNSYMKKKTILTVAKILCESGMLGQEAKQIEGVKMNSLPIEKMTDQFKDRCIIIRNAERLNDETATKLEVIGTRYKARTSFVLEGSRPMINAFFREHSELGGLFSNRIHVPRLEEEDILGMAVYKIQENYYKLEPDAVDALTERISKLYRRDNENCVKAVLEYSKRVSAMMDEKNAARLYELASKGNLFNSGILNVTRKDIEEAFVL